MLGEKGSASEILGTWKLGEGRQVLGQSVRMSESVCVNPALTLWAHVSLAWSEEREPLSASIQPRGWVMLERFLDGQGLQGLILAAVSAQGLVIPDPSSEARRRKNRRSVIQDLLHEAATAGPRRANRAPFWGCWGRGRNFRFAVWIG